MFSFVALFFTFYMKANFSSFVFFVRTLVNFTQFFVCFNFVFFNNRVQGKERVHFRTMKFAEKYKLGEPLCVNYFLMDRQAPTEPPTEPMI